MTKFFLKQTSAENALSPRDLDQILGRDVQAPSSVKLPGQRSGVDSITPSKKEQPFAAGEAWPLLAIPAISEASADSF